jgi:hypothetical protein
MPPDRAAQNISAASPVSGDPSLSERVSETFCTSRVKGFKTPVPPGNKPFPRTPGKRRRAASGRYSHGRKRSVSPATRRAAAIWVRAVPPFLIPRARQPIEMNAVEERGWPARGRSRDDPEPRVDGELSTNLRSNRRSASKRWYDLKGFKTPIPRRRERRGRQRSPELAKEPKQSVERFTTVATRDQGASARTRW